MANRSSQIGSVTRQYSGGPRADVLAKLASARASGLGWLKQFGESRGSQLVEFALCLPFLAVILIGIADFGQAYNTKHILVNAAREAARITASNPLSDSSCPSGWNGTYPPSGTPCSIAAAAEAVKDYLTNNGLSAASCITPSSATSGGTAAWTYSCNNISLTINKGYSVTGGAGGLTVPSTQVTLSYPYKFSFGYVIGLLGGTGPTGTKTLSTTVVMQTLVF